MGQAFEVKIDSQGIAHMVFDIKGEKVNKLSPDIIEELENHLDELKNNHTIQALIITSAKKGIFVAGADLNSFEPAFRDQPKIKKLLNDGHRTFNQLENMPFPTIAVINGVCLGGGLELALACNYRIVVDNPKTSLGLPETTLGIIPGWGGSQRLPRLVGLTQGTMMILTGKPVNAVKAFKIKLADSITQEAFLESDVQKFIKKVLTEKGRKQIYERRQISGIKSWLLEKNPLGRQLLFTNAKKGVLKKTKGHYPAPLIALDLIKKSYGTPLKKGLELEKETFFANVNSGFLNAINLIQVFFNNDLLKKHPGGPVGVEGKKVKTVGVLGAGTMGAAIAWAFSYKDIPVRMKDINWKQVAHGYKVIEDIYKVLIKIRKLTKNKSDYQFQKVSGTIDYSGFQDLDLIIEAAVENLNLKHMIFQEIEDVVRPDAVIASNTSSLTIDEMAQPMKHPERFLGMHFFNPANRMPLVEIVPGSKTSSEAIATAISACQRIGKTPIVVKDCHGFLVNRIFVMGASEICHMLDEGVPMQDLEKMMLDFGMPMAPFVLSDEVGNDVSYHVSHQFEEAYGSRMKMPNIVDQMFKAGFYGKKIGKGFYLYEGKKRTPNPEVEKLLLNKGEKIKIPKEKMEERAIFSMINEAAICLQDQIVSEPSHIDMAMILGTAFPPFRGGLLRFADQKGISYIVDQMRKLQEKHGERFTPAQLLQDMAKNNETFYSSKKKENKKLIHS